ncbi:MAG: hypothetical protein ACR2NK_00045 [Mariniblastus sp.]
MGSPWPLVYLVRHAAKGDVLENPYSSPRAKSSCKGFPRTRFWNALVMCLGAGTIAAIMVYVGDAFRWPNFNRRGGFIGTEFIDALLYAINDPYAIHIVAFLWFLYAAFAIAIFLYLFRLLCHRM